MAKPKIMADIGNTKQLITNSKELVGAVNEVKNSVKYGAFLENTDLNTIKEGGYYTVALNCTNKPCESFAILEVTPCTHENRARQLFIGDNSVSYTRDLTPDGTWSAWTQLLNVSQAEKDTWNSKVDASHSHSSLYMADSNASIKIGMYAPNGTGIYGGNSDGASIGEVVDGASNGVCNLILSSWYGIGFANTCSGAGNYGINIAMNVREGAIQTRGDIWTRGKVFIGDSMGDRLPASTTQKEDLVLLNGFTFGYDENDKLQVTRSGNICNIQGHIKNSSSVFSGTVISNLPNWAVPSTLRRGYGLAKKDSALCPLDVSQNGKLVYFGEGLCDATNQIYIDFTYSTI